ncbi:glycosyl transferase family 1 [Rhodopila sp.]|uniref:glycosyl transferase family 1 n=1 Tax=Rhodopila sp. TaxID=2480087 RepID=UPI003D10AC5D
MLDLACKDAAPAAIHVTYFANDLADAAVARRVHMLQIGGARVTVIGFRRTEQPIHQVSGAEAIDLGRTFDARFLDRAMKVLRRSLEAGRWKDLVVRSDVLLARNVEMAVVADCARIWSGANVRLVYECLDIHGLLLASGIPSALLRWWERRLISRCAALIVSSPGFLVNYFERLGIPLPTVVVSENKRTNPAADLQRPAVDTSRVHAPWRVGWFGNIRCVRSFEILKDLARCHPNLIDVELRGRPTSTLKALIAEHLPLRNMRFGGPYVQTELASIYQPCHLAWAIDFWQQGQNSDWLLPNRIYEGGFFNCPPIALAGTETARWLEDRAAGVILQSPEEEFETFVTTLTAARYAELKHAVAAIPTTDLVHTVEECERFANVLAGRPVQ